MLLRITILQCGYYRHRFDRLKLVRMAGFALQEDFSKYSISELLAIEMSNITYYNERLACGIAIQFEKQTGVYSVNILYSGNFLHSSPVAVNLISNMILQRASRGQYEIHVNNNPLMRYTIFGLIVRLNIV